MSNTEVKTNKREKALATIGIRSFLTVVIILLCALLINALNGYKARKSFFMIELPEYKLPSFLSVDSLEIMG